MLALGQCDLILCKYKNQKIHYRMAKMQGEGKKVDWNPEIKLKNVYYFKMYMQQQGIQIGL